MQPQVYAEFLEKLGHTVREAHGVYWFNVFSHAWISFPLETELSPGELDPSRILGRDGLGMVRYCCSPNEGAASFRHVVSESGYGLSSLDPKARNKTRQGLESCECGPVEAGELSAEGIRLHAETLTRQGRRLPVGYEKYWRAYFEALSTCPAATIWACRYQGVLASFLISFRIGTVENISIIRSRAELLRHRPNNAMLFTFLQHALQREGTSEVCIGLQSLQANMSSLDMFKRGMGFEERPIGQRIEVCAPLGMGVPRFLARLAGSLAERVGGEHAARLAGALSVYASQPRIRGAA